MLQCTAVAPVPYAEALLALATLEGGPEHPPDVLAPDEFLLCELGEHDESVEHAAYLWAARTPDVDQDLWLLYAGTGAHRLYRLDILPLCPARLRGLATHTVTSCAYFDHHPGPHSFFVTDPLGDLITSPNGIDEP
ncbi:hypothetical protein [Streptomyces cyaneofuscatus]|uniref:hypothetical protein n=1 Tax=Streptomyces cyaneofuscatus TaxID=66883 RepID=UPI0004C699B7|nr:hypothetical protein [Streptomyces cyaneofuscatus]